jgi:hypothetical protein
VKPDFFFVNSALIDGRNGGLAKAKESSLLSRISTRVTCVTFTCSGVPEFSATLRYFEPRETEFSNPGRRLWTPWLPMRQLNNKGDFLRTPLRRESRCEPRVSGRLRLTKYNLIMLLDLETKVWLNVSGHLSYTFFCRTFIWSVTTNS